jgi:hypothetical protein
LVEPLCRREQAGSGLKGSMSYKKEFERLATVCARLASEADTPELRKRLVQMAREYASAAEEIVIHQVHRSLEKEIKNFGDPPPQITPD